MPEYTDRIAGCIFGGAIGDAYGGPFEGQSPPVPANPHATLRLSDDTQMTLATCEAVAAAGEVDPAKIAASFSRWFQEGRITGIGASTLKALTGLAHGGHWALVGRKGEMAAGNGAAMRMAPLAFLLDPFRDEHRTLIRDTSRITHHNEEAYIGALAIVIALWMTHSGSWEGENNLAVKVTERLPDSLVRDRLLQLSCDEKDTPIPELAGKYGNSGYVVESVPLALCCASRVMSLGFEPLIIQVIHAGGDADTIASMTGQIAGTLLGLSSLPETMLARLPDTGTIRSITADFCRIATSIATKRR